ncbi:hypothetical protein [Paraburkholderia nemoris]|uniref:hypothetical protein n=1 Tax=Paraburkholderia nemoris TaxID=2793076 RepID=UPI001B1F1C81|nr:hypothetical protein [Paraburkholderia nemoris]CAE6839421.1 hypothetical protein R75777_06997 [Paraburkholderia nemoris]
MSNEQTLSRRFGAAEVKVPADELFSAWFKQQLGMTVNVCRDVPSIGAAWPGEGGVNGGLGRKEDGTPEWLIVPPIDVGYFKEVTYGGYGKDIPGAASWYDGRANTVALLAAGDACQAARKCADLSHEGHSDYFLPAKLQLAQIYASLHGVIPKEWVLSSTQYSANNAWTQGFYGGYTGYWDKDYRAGALAVRSISF